MTGTSEPQDANDPRVQAALRDYFERSDRGEAIDRDRFLAEHIEIAEELRSVFETDHAGKSPAKVSPLSTRSVAERAQETVPPARIKASAASVAGESLIPAQFGRYRVVRPLGSGAMGTVYLAEDTQLERKVALKTPSFDQDETGELLERFYREARSAATLRNPHICPVYDVGEIDGRHYISMAYIEGRPLSAYIQPDKPQTERQILLLVRKLALALQEAHDSGIVHRDLKPSNVMVDQRGEPIIMDFGLARKVYGEDEARLTHSGTIVGSPAYMAPEQVEGQPRKIGPATDQYSLGVMLYELLTGALPFRGSMMAVLGQIVTKEPAPPSTLRADLDPRIESVCLRMMAKSPGSRFPSMKSVAEAVTAIVKEPRASGVKQAPPPESKSVERSQTSTARPAAPTERSLAKPGELKRNIASLLEAARKCLRRHDYEQVVQLLEQIPEPQRNAEVAALLDKARTLSDEVAFLLTEIEEALRYHDDDVALQKADELLKLKPGHHRAKEIKEQCSQSGPGKVFRFGRGGSRGRTVGEGSWIPWAALVVFVTVFGVMYGVVTLYLRSGSAVVRVQINDPNVKVTLQDRTITVEDNGRELKINPNDENTLTINYGELTFTSEKFTLKKGENPAVVVDLLDSSVAARFGEQPLGEWPVTPLPGGEGRNDYDAIATGQWVSIMSELAAVASANSQVKYQDGVLEIDASEGLPRNSIDLVTSSIRARDAIIRGKVRLLPAAEGTIQLSTRYERPIGRYLGQLLPKASQIGRMTYNEPSGGGWATLTAVPDDDETTKTREAVGGEFVEFALSSIGSQHAIYLNGRKLADAEDSKFAHAGPVAIGVRKTKAWFKDVEVQVLDPSSTQGGPPADAVEFKGHFYKYFPEKLSWKEAKHRCEQLGGHLPFVETVAENEFLTQLADRGFPREGRNGMEAVWLGATDDAKESEWRWADGSLVGYMNWAANQPNNKGAGENYALLWLPDASKSPRFKKGEWSDQPNVSEQHLVHFICEWDSRASTATPQAGPWTDLLANFAPDAQNSRGIWTRTAQGHLSGERTARWPFPELKFPARPNIGYELECGVKFGAADHVFVHVPAGAGVASLLLLRGLNTVAWQVDGPFEPRTKMPDSHTAFSIVSEAEYVVRVRVQVNGTKVRLEGTINDQPLPSLEGDATKFSGAGRPPNFKGTGGIGSLRDSLSVHVGVGSTATVTRFRYRLLEPTGGQAASNWIDLFNGRDLSGWEVADQPGAWRVENGVIVAGGPGRGHLVTKTDYADFELRFDYRLQKGANSGVFLRVPSDVMPVGQLLEIQLVDEAVLAGAKRDVKETHNGALFGLAAPDSNPANPAGQWNTMQIRAVGRQLVVTLNGREIQRADLDRLAASHPSNVGLKRTSGRIALQHWTEAGVEFRNLRLREFPPKAVTTAQQGAMPKPADKTSGTVLLDVDFRTSNGGFSQGDEHHIRAEHKDGEYRYLGKKTGWWYGGLHPVLHREKNLRDFILETDVRLAEPKRGRFAIHFGRVGTDHYRLCLNQEGQLALYWRDQEVVPWIRAPDMRPITEFNTLRLAVQEKTAKVSVNGRPLLEKRLDRYAASNVTFWLEPDEVPFDSRLRRFRLERLESPAPPEFRGEVRRLKGHIDVIRGVAFLPDNQRAVSVGHDKTLKLWDLTTGQVLHDFAGHTAHVTSVSVSGDGRRALTGCDDDLVRLWDLENRTLLKTLRGHTADVVHVAISRDGLIGMSCSHDGTIRQWDLKTSKSKIVPGPSADPRLAVSPDGTVLASGHPDGVVALRGPAGIATLVGHGPGLIEGLTFSPDATRLVTAAADCTVRVWDMTSGKQLHRLDGDDVGFASVAVTNDGRYALAGSADQTIRIWDIQSGEPVLVCRADQPVTQRLALSPQNDSVLSGGGERDWKPTGDYDLRLWKLPSPPAPPMPLAE